MVDFPNSALKVSKVTPISQANQTDSQLKNAE